MKKYFDNIYCINLDSRTDRWQDCQVEFKQLGLEDNIERFSACTLKDMPGIAGCTKSHYEVIKLAKSRGEKNILIFEDDFQAVRDDLWEVLKIVYDQIEANNISFDMLYLGGRIADKNGASIVDENLLKLSYVKTTHAYIINEQIFDIIINFFDSVNWYDHWNWSQSNNDRLNIDLWYIHNIQQKHNVYGIYPAVFQQRTSYSDIINRDSGECIWNVNDHWNLSSNIKF